MSKHSDYTDIVPADDVKRDDRQGELFEPISRRAVLGGLAAVGAFVALPYAVASEPPVHRFIVPDIVWVKRQTRIADEHNTYTIVYEVMNRWTVEDGAGLRSIEVATVGSDAYRQWLLDDTPEGGIPPHIQFGGAIVPGERDETFKARWVERTLAKLASGELA